MRTFMKAVCFFVVFVVIVDVPVLWAASLVNGIAICTATGDQLSPQIISDGAGGAIITWCANRSGNWDIYAQRVNASGAVQWTANGVAICMATGTQESPQITSDGAGGAIITWSDYRSKTWDIYADIYAQRVNASGAVQWTANGIAICTSPSKMSPEIISDGAGGAIIMWRDYRSRASEDIYAQRAPAGIADVSLTSKATTGLSQNVPNPFNPVTVIRFAVASPGWAELRVYDVVGRPVRTLAEGVKAVGAMRLPGTDAMMVVCQ
jgi:hypothetical protein